MTQRGLIILAFLLAVASPATAFAFCGFYVAGSDAKLYNDATQVVLMRDERTTVLSMQNNYEGPPEDFAMVVPVPEVLQKDRVKTLDKDLFDRVDTLSAPRLVEYWERNPCQPQGGLLGDAFGSGGLGLRGTGRGGGGFGRGTVRIEAQFEVGEYDVVVLSADDASALDTWLKANKYKIPDGAEPYFRPYIEKGTYFFVARVSMERVTYENGEAVLSPLRFHYESDEFSLPIRLGMINSKGSQDLLIYMLGYNQRFDVANYPNVTIPTNLEVAPRVRDGFGEFYEALFSRTVEENPKAVVTEYSWAAAKCDPCPSGIIGGAALRAEDLARLGNDIINKSAGWNVAGWTLTRLHARYGPDDIGEDLIFQKADAIIGGREVYVGNDRTLEKGAMPSSVGNNFQGRYIMRYEWEGDVTCDNPQRGVWGGPPDAHGMTLVADTIVETMRRAAANGRALTPEELTAPHTAAEQAEIAVQLRRRFGTSVAPASDQTGPSSAPSANTRGGNLGNLLPLATLVREPIPELKVLPVAAPKEVEQMPVATNTTQAPAANDDAKTNAKPKSGCAIASGRSPLSAWLSVLAIGFAGVLARGRRRR